MGFDFGFHPARPHPRATASARAALVAMGALLAFLVPSLSMAASITLTELNDDGVGATLTLDDGLEPGALSITIDSEGPGELVGDLLGYWQAHEIDALHPDLTAVGPDIARVNVWSTIADGKSSACPCMLNAIFGTPTFLELTGITSTSFVLEHPSEDVTLDSFAGSTFFVALGFPQANLVQDPDDHFGDSPSPGITVRLVKIKGTISVIPEPTTATLMMIGLLGLATRARRLS